MNKKYSIFLDDIRKPIHVTWVRLPNVTWTIVRNYKEFCDTISNNGIPEFVAYDHDLSDADYGTDNEKTGYDCCKFLCNLCMKLNIKHPAFVVHSMNPVGKRNIESYIESYSMGGTTQSRL